MAAPIIKATPEAQQIAKQLARFGVASVAQLLSLLDLEGAEAVADSLRRVGALPEVADETDELVDPADPDTDTDTDTEGTD